jgi:hypothetical protein
MISEGFEIPLVERLRICFFLHYYEEGKSLDTIYGKIKCPMISQIPERLKNIIDYEPVD